MKGTFSRTSTSSAPSSSPVDHRPLGRVIAGPGSIGRLGEVVRELGAVRVLLVTDPGLEQTGHPRRAASFLTEAGLTVVRFEGVKENPTEREVEAGVKVAREGAIECIVALGGGSSMY